MPHFVIVSHKTPPSGDWGLDDLPGLGGRVDVLCRAVSSAMFVSHGIRSDTQVTLVFAAQPKHPVAVRFDGLHVQHLNPDERSTAARIRKALQARHEDPWWEEVEPGVHVAPMDLRDILTEATSPVIWLDRDGTDATSALLPGDGLYIMSDHVPFTKEEEGAIQRKSAQRVSVGHTWYHGHHVIGILQFLVDQQGPQAQP